MKKTDINYWTSLMHCHGGNAGGCTTVVLTKREYADLKACIENEPQCNRWFSYLEANLSPELYEKVRNSITEDFRRVQASDMLDACGMDAFDEEISMEEFDEMTEDQLIDRLLAECPMDECNYEIVEIEILN